MTHTEFQERLRGLCRAMRRPTINDQIHAVVEAAGGQNEVVRRVREAGGKLSQPQLSRLTRGTTPTVATLTIIGEVFGVLFVVGAGIEIGEPRKRRPSEENT